MSGEPPPLDETLRALVEVERSVGASPAAGKAMVKARLDALLAGPGGGGDGGGGAGLGAGARLTRLAAAFAAGAVVGGAIVYAALPPRIVERVLQIEPPAQVSLPSPSPSASAPLVQRSAPLPSVDEAAAPALASASRPSGDSLAAERALLDPARTALGRGDGASALQAVRKHEAGFRNGALAEEREAIAVQALVQLGRKDAARSRGERFLARYPGSVLAPVVKAALEAAQ
jgi:hypothetical protein